MPSQATTTTAVIYDGPSLLPPRKEHTLLTVAIDLDGTLVAMPTLRPYVHFLLHRLRYCKVPINFFDQTQLHRPVEIVIWSAGTRCHVQQCLDLIDPNGHYIDHAICRSERWVSKSDFENVGPLKDVHSLFGADRASSAVLVDDLLLAAILSKGRAIIVPIFTGNNNRDATLLWIDAIIEFLIISLSALRLTRSALSSPPSSTTTTTTTTAPISDGDDRRNECLALTLCGIVRTVQTAIAASDVISNHHTRRRPRQWLRYQWHRDHRQWYDQYRRRFGVVVPASSSTPTTTSVVHVATADDIGSTYTRGFANLVSDMLFFPSSSEIEYNYKCLDFLLGNHPHLAARTMVTTTINGKTPLTIGARMFDASVRQPGFGVQTKHGPFRERHIFTKTTIRRLCRIVMEDAGVLLSARRGGSGGRSGGNDKKHRMDSRRRVVVKKKRVV